jgi:hypothetical protein
MKEENRDIFVEKVSINENGILYIKPKNYSFDMIYRSAMGIHWDEKICCLYHNSPQKWDSLQWYKHMILAVKSEYDKDLKIYPGTVYDNVDDVLKTAIESI